MLIFSSSLLIIASSKDGILNSDIYTFQYLCYQAWNSDIINEDQYLAYINGTNINQRLFNNMMSSLKYRGLIDQETLSSFTFDVAMEKNNKFLRLLYLTNLAWGEYSAYSTDANYIDSVAGDVYAPDTTTSADKEKESRVIANHVEDLYNDNQYTEPYPDFIPWTRYV